MNIVRLTVIKSSHRAFYLAKGIFPDRQKSMTDLRGNTSMRLSMRKEWCLIQGGGPEHKSAVFRSYIQLYEYDLDWSIPKRNPMKTVVRATLLYTDRIIRHTERHV